MRSDVLMAIGQRMYDVRAIPHKDSSQSKSVTRNRLQRVLYAKLLMIDFIKFQPEVRNFTVKSEQTRSLRCLLYGFRYAKCAK